MGARICLMGARICPRHRPRGSPYLLAYWVQRLPALSRGRWFGGASTDSSCGVSGRRRLGLDRPGGEPLKIEYVLSLPHDHPGELRGISGKDGRPVADARQQNECEQSGAPRSERGWVRPNRPLPNDQVCGRPRPPISDEASAASSAMAARNAPPKIALENASGSRASQTWKVRTIARKAAYPHTTARTISARCGRTFLPATGRLGTGCRRAMTTMATKATYAATRGGRTCRSTIVNPEGRRTILG